MRIPFKQFGLLALGLLPAFAFAALTNGKVQVGLVKDEAYLYDAKGKKEPLKSARVFQEGFRVETTPKNTVELILSNGSTLIVSPDTLLEVKTFRQVVSSLIVDGEYQKLDKEPSPSITEIEVIRGKVIGEVRKLNPQSSYTIKTPVGVARIRGTIYTVEFADNGKGTGTLNVACVRGSVEATVFAANAGPIAVKPGDQLTVQAPVPKPVAPTTTGTTPGTGTGTGTAPGTGTGAPETGTAPAPEAPAPAPVIALAPMNSAQLGSVATTLATVSSLDQGIAATVKNMADNAPPPPPPVAPVTTTNPDGTTTTTTPAPEIPPSKPLTPPTTPTSTSTGGGTTSTEAAIQKVTETVQKTVETQTQTNPSPTGG
jgi:hypothetical protein